MNEWISVEDRLPDGNKTVLAYAKYRQINNELSDPFIMVATKYQRGNKDIWWEDDNCVYLEDVTHWMPLPEPPEEKE